MINLIDPRMQKDGFSVREVMKTIHMALLCLQPLPDIRPAMSEIVAMLTWKAEMVKSPIKPAFLDRRRRENDENVSRETISNGFPSLETESPSLTQPPNSREFDVKGEIIV
ncbi:putative non-specific serine/threonine protein kinase [Helianthus debilis subsp. tardiflorus]